MKAMYIVVNEGFSQDAVKLLDSAGATGATIINARGGASELNRFNVPIEPAKEIIISLVSDEVSKKISQLIKESMGFGSEANGISYCMEVDSVNFINKINS